jgi:hypothetical protein
MDKTGSVAIRPKNALESEFSLKNLGVTIPHRGETEDQLIAAELERHEVSPFPRSRVARLIFQNFFFRSVCGGSQWPGVRF